MKYKNQFEPWTDSELSKLIWLAKVGYGNQQILDNFMFLFPNRKEGYLIYMLTEIRKMVTCNPGTRLGANIYKRISRVMKNVLMTNIPSDLEVILPSYTNIKPKYVNEIKFNADILTYLGQKKRVAIAPKDKIKVEESVPLVDHKSEVNKTETKKFIPIKEYLSSHPEIKQENNMQDLTNTIIDQNAVKMINDILNSVLTSGQTTIVSINSKDIKFEFTINRKE